MVLCIYDSKNLSTLWFCFAVSWGVLQYIFCISNFVRTVMNIYYCCWDHYYQTKHFASLDFVSQKSPNDAEEEKKKQENENENENEREEENEEENENAEPEEVEEEGDEVDEKPEKHRAPTNRTNAANDSDSSSDSASRWDGWFFKCSLF